MDQMMHPFSASGRTAPYIFRKCHGPWQQKKNKQVFWLARVLSVFSLPIHVLRKGQWKKTTLYRALTAAAPHGTHTHFPFHRLNRRLADTYSVKYITYSYLSVKSVLIINDNSSLKNLFLVLYWKSCVWQLRISNEKGLLTDEFFETNVTNMYENV